MLHHQLQSVPLSLEWLDSTRITTRQSINAIPEFLTLLFPCTVLPWSVYLQIIFFSSLSSFESIPLCNSAHHGSQGKQVLGYLADVQRAQEPAHHYLVVEPYLHREVRTP